MDISLSPEALGEISKYIQHLSSGGSFNVGGMAPPPTPAAPPMPSPMQALPNPTTPPPMQAPSPEPSMTDMGTPAASPEPTQSQDSDLMGQVKSIFTDPSLQHSNIFRDQLANLISQAPQRAQTGKWRNLLAGIASLHPSPAGIAGGQPIGYVRGDPAQFLQNMEMYKDPQFYRSMNDWLSILKPVEAGAVDERASNRNLDILRNNIASRIIGATNADTRATDTASKVGLRDVQGTALQENADTKAYLADLRAQMNEHIMALKDVPDSRKLEMMREIALSHDANALQRALASISARHNATMGEIGERERMKEQYLALDEPAKERLALYKAQAQAQFGDTYKLTNQTKNLMQGAQMMMPAVDRLKNMASVLNDNGDFGILKSKIRHMMTSINWGGTPEEIAKAVDDYQASIADDPDLHGRGSGMLRGEFASTLSFVASGMARVHAMRGGTQMIMHIQNALSDAGDFDAFMGRLAGLQNQLRDYAKGPKTVGPKMTAPGAPVEKGSSQDIVNKILAGQKK